MSADRHLATLLHSLQTVNVQQDTARLYPTAASLLVNLTNPLNLSLLTTQLLIAPAIWARPDGLQTSLGIFTIFHSASRTFLENRAVLASQGGQLVNRNLSDDTWIRAVVKGADDRSPRWRHLLVLGGILAGLGSVRGSSIDSNAGRDLQDAVVKAMNLALQQTKGVAEDGPTIVLVACHVFDALSDWNRSSLDYDALIPLLVETTYFSNQGLQSGYFLGAIDSHVVQIGNSQFTWSVKSATFYQLQKLSANPIVGSLGALARVASYGFRFVKHIATVNQTVERLVYFSDVISSQWRSNKLSEIDISDEISFLHSEAIQSTLPALWKLLKSTLLSSLMILQGVLEKVLNDRILASNGVAVTLSTRILDVLRNLYFITARFGTQAFSVHDFLHLTSVDILSTATPVVVQFLEKIKPLELSKIPSHPRDRTLALFFLNTAERLVPVLSPGHCSSLIIPSASPYLDAGSPHLLELFEAAHSVLLSVLSAPQNAQLAVDLLPSYTESLFRAFPSNISDRQFRLAFKTLVSISSPPATLAGLMPEMPSLLLEMLHNRALLASSTPLQITSPSKVREAMPDGPRLSEQAYLVLAFLDSVPFVSIQTLEEVLELASELVSAVANPMMQDVCRGRFWEVLSSGEIDVEKSQISVAWWTSKGGRQAVTSGLLQSNALSAEDKLQIQQS